jgi:ATP-dependent exoDNAse (exonuclease V) beta subunit
MSLTYLSTKNSHERDEYITFDEPTHIYTIHGKKGYTSTTTFIHSLFEEFNETKIVKNIMKSPRMKDVAYKYHGMTAKEITDGWEKNRVEASNAGTKLHADIENYYNNIEVSNTSIEYGYFKMYLSDFHHIIPYRTEWMVYDEEWKISGSIDMLYENPDGSLIIADWKRAKEITYDSPYKKVAIPSCISHIPDTNFWHYSLQLNIYRAILERNYGKRVSSLYLVRLHPDNPYKTYDKINVPLMDNEISILMEYRKKLIE